MTNEIINQDEANVPSWMKQKSTGAVLGNLGADDIRPPEVKLLQATSPECGEQPGAVPGAFWLTGQNMNLGTEIIGTPIILKKTFVIWNPTKSLDTKGPLAVASDGIHWDIPNQKFTVYYPNNPTPYTWETKRTVRESGLDQFGSSRPDDPRSTPAASATFQTLWAFRLPNGKPQLGVITNSKSGIKPMKDLFGMIDARKPIDHFFLRFKIQAVRVSVRPGEYFFSYKYFAAGQLEDEAEGDAYKAMYDRYRKAGFSTAINDEIEANKPAQTYAPTTADNDDSDEIQY